MSEVATKQDLYNVGVLIDSNFKSLAGDIHNLRTDMDAQFVRVDSQFARVASEFVAVRSEMRSLLTTFKDEINKTTMRTGFATFLAVVALFGIDRWWSYLLLSKLKRRAHIPQVGKHWLKQRAR